ncbi:MAG: hypothetical protein ACI9XC_001765 [Gammaproteobacteria bacterium]|jgi:hypothetical protein
MRTIYTAEPKNIVAVSAKPLMDKFIFFSTVGYINTDMIE